MSSTYAASAVINCKWKGWPPPPLLPHACLTGWPPLGNAVFAFPPVGGLLDPLSTGRCQGSYQMPKVANLEVERKGGGPAWGWFPIPEVWS